MARKQWRCFFCDEVLTTRSAALEHFGVWEGCEADMPACQIKAHEKHLVRYIRKLKKELRRYMHEETPVLLSIMTLEADHQTALRRAEEQGYHKGITDMRNQLQNGGEL